MKPSDQQIRLPYDPIVKRKKLRWSNGARVAVLVVPNVEYFPIELAGPCIRPASASLKPDVANHSWREYGPRIGIWRLMETMRRHDVRGTVALNAAVCDQYPDILDAGRALGWEFMGHGWTNAEPLPGLSAADERALLTKVRDRLSAYFGAPPRGWLSPALNENPLTLELLKEVGYDYLCDWVHDDQPTWLKTRNGPLLAMPYSMEINDLPAFLVMHHSADEFCSMICAQFDQLYEEGADTARVLAIGLHPFLIGTPYRIKALDKALQHIRTRSEVWFATGAEIADDFVRQTHS